MTQPPGPFPRRDTILGPAVTDAAERLGCRAPPPSISKLAILVRGTELLCRDLRLEADRGCRVIYAADFTEVDAYMDPAETLKLTLFGIELGDKDKKTTERRRHLEVLKRWRRAKWLFFECQPPVLIFPPHARELFGRVSYLELADRHPEVRLTEFLRKWEPELRALSAHDYQTVLNVARRWRVLAQLPTLDTVTRSRERLLSDDEAVIITRFLRSVPAALANKIMENEAEFRSAKMRLGHLMDKSDFGFWSTYDWKLADLDSASSEKMRAIDIDRDHSTIVAISSILASVRGNKSAQMADVRDAQALVLLHRTNEILTVLERPAEVRLVTHSPAVHDAVDCIEQALQRTEAPTDQKILSRLLAPVRHPQLVAGQIAAGMTAQNLDSLIRDYNKIRLILHQKVEDLSKSFEEELIKRAGDKKPTKLIKNEVESAIGEQISDAIMWMDQAVAGPWSRLSDVLFAEDLAHDETAVRRLEDDFKSGSVHLQASDWDLYLGEILGEEIFGALASGVLENVEFDLDALFGKFIVPDLVGRTNFHVFPADGDQCFVMVRARAKGGSAAKMRYAFKFSDPGLLRALRDAQDPNLTFQMIVQRAVDRIAADAKQATVTDFLLQALVTANDGNWPMVATFCESARALPSAQGNSATREIEYLLHFAYRGIAFMEYGTDARAQGYMRQAIEYLQLFAISQDKDPRAKLAGLALELSMLANWIIRPRDTLGIGLTGLPGFENLNLESRIEAMWATALEAVEEFKANPVKTYGDYGQMRALQIYLTVALAIWSGLVPAEGDKEFEGQEMPLRWDEIYSHHDTVKKIADGPFSSERLPTLRIVLDTITVKRTNDPAVWSEGVRRIQENCHQLTGQGFARQFAQAVMTKILEEGPPGAKI